MAKSKQKAKRKPKRKAKPRRASGKRAPKKKRATGTARPSGGAGRKLAALLSTLGRAYGHRRRPAAEKPLDMVIMAVLSEGRGERSASRLVSRFKSDFVDWNEVRVARPRDLAASAPDAPGDRVKKMQGLLQVLYENLGSLAPEPLLAMKSTEARVWLARNCGLSREEIDAVLMIAFGLPVMPASEDLARVLRRLGQVPRKATRARAHRTAFRSLKPEQYREFYGLIGEHAAAVCHAAVPECKRCKLKRICKSKGKW